MGRRPRLPAAERVAAAAAPAAGAALDRGRRGRRIASTCRSRGIELTALAKSLNLTEATRFVTLLDLAGISRRTQDPESAPFRERGFDVQFQIPIFDGGEVRVRQAAETYNLAFNRLTEKAVNVRSEARDAYRVYRSTYDIAEPLPARDPAAAQDHHRGDAAALLQHAGRRLRAARPKRGSASPRCARAIDARRDFFLAQSELQTAVNGGGARRPAASESDQRSPRQRLAGGGH